MVSLDENYGIEFVHLNKHHRWFADSSNKFRAFALGQFDRNLVKT